MAVDPDFNFVATCTPIPSTATFSLNGFPAITGLGTATARTTYSHAARYLWFPRVGYVSAATAGSFAGLRTTILWLPEPANWTVKIRFSISDPATVSGARMFAGISNTTGALGNVEPSTLLNCFGIGHGAADTKWQIYCAGSTTGTPIDTGLSLASTGMIDLTLSNTVSGLVYRVDLDGGGGAASRSGIASGFTQAANTATNPINIMRTNNATALAVSLDILKIAICLTD